MPPIQCPPDDLRIDPIDPHFYDDPRSAIEWLQREAPVFLYDPRPRYPHTANILSRWRDVHEALGNNSVFSTTDPGQAEKLRSNPELIPNAVEEQLRCATAIRYFTRTLREDVKLHGEALPAGSLVLLSLLAANFDAEIYPDPFVFDVARSFENPHVAFGYGPHFCIGATLARFEIRLILEELATRFSHWELAAPATRQITGMGIVLNEPAKIPARFHV